MASKAIVTRNALAVSVLLLQVWQLAVEQQLAGRDFAVTDSSKHQNKKARLDRMSQVWDWLHCSNAAGVAAANGGSIYPTAEGAEVVTSLAAGECTTAAEATDAAEAAAGPSRDSVVLPSQQQLQEEQQQQPQQQGEQGNQQANGGQQQQQQHDHPQSGQQKQQKQNTVQNVQLS